MKNKLLIAFSLIIILAGLSSCYVEEPYGYYGYYYHPAPRYYYIHPHYHHYYGWHGDHRGWARGGGEHRAGRR